MHEHQTQVSKEHYGESYDTLKRFISYYFQIRLVADLQPHTVLEVGKGNGTVSDYLGKRGLSVTTCDYDATVEPDVVADIRKLPFDADAFDVVMCCEVLEHLPWEDVEQVLADMCVIARRYVVLSVPYPTASVECIMRFPAVAKLCGKPFLRLFAKLPILLPRLPFDGQHYWELGRRGTPVRALRTLLRRHFVIRQELRPPLDAYHYFFVLEKKRD